MRTERVIAALVPMALLVTAHASAERLSRAVTDVTTLERPGGGFQVVFRWDPAIGEGDVAVRQALLRFELQGQQIESTRTLRVYPVTSPWSGGSVTVEFDEEIWCRTEMSFDRSGTGVLDLTNVVKEIVEEGLTTYGFLLTVGPSDGEGLNEDELARLAGLSNGTVEVTWRRVPPTPTRRQG